MFNFLDRLKWLFSPLYSEGPKIKDKEEIEMLMELVYGDKNPYRKKENAAESQVDTEDGDIKEKADQEVKVPDDPS